MEKRIEKSAALLNASLVVRVNASLVVRGQIP
jgi:hypothetical protein